MLTSPNTRLIRRGSILKERVIFNNEKEMKVNDH